MVGVRVLLESQRSAQYLVLSAQEKEGKRYKEKEGQAALFF